MTNKQVILIIEDEKNIGNYILSHIQIVLELLAKRLNFY